MAPKKNFCYIFVLGIHFLSFVAIHSIKELFEILSEGPQLVVLHEQSDDRMSHLHVVFAVGERSRHAKVQLFMRYLCSFIKDSIKNRFGLIDHLKLSNIPCTDFDVEKLACCLYCQDKTTHNAENLTDVTDKITQELKSRSVGDYLPLDLDCLDLGISAEKQKEIHLHTGNYDRSHYGDDSSVNNKKDLIVMEDTEAVR